MKVNAQLKAANAKSEKDKIGGRISQSNSPGKRRGRQPSMSFLKSQATSMGFHNDSIMSKPSIDEPIVSNLEDIQEKVKEEQIVISDKKKQKLQIKKEKNIELNEVNSDSLINVIPTELKDHIKLAKKVQDQAPPSQLEITEDRPDTAGPWTANFSQADEDEKHIRAMASPKKVRKAVDPPPKKKSKARQQAEEEAALLQSGTVFGMSSDAFSKQDRALQLRTIQKDEAAKLKSKMLNASRFSNVRNGTHSLSETNQNSRLRGSNQVSSTIDAPRGYHNLQRDEHRRDTSRFSYSRQDYMQKQRQEPKKSVRDRLRTSLP